MGEDTLDKDDIKAIIKTAKNINKVQFEDGSLVTLKVKPKFAYEKTKLGIEFNKEFKDTDVEVTVKVNGQVATFISGINNSDFTCSASATKRF